MSNLIKINLTPTSYSSKKNGHKIVMLYIVRIIPAEYKNLVPKGVFRNWIKTQI